MNANSGNHQGDGRSDSELVALFVAVRDERAFRVLYRRHSARLLRLLIRLVGGRRQDAEDLLQESWVRATHNLGALRLRENFYGWLRGIAINVFNDSRRREGRRSRMLPLDSRDLGDALAEGVSVAEGVATGRDSQQEAIWDLERSILLLPDGYRTILVLHDVEGFTHEEIAELLGIAPGTSKSQLSAARRQVRRSMNELSEKDGEDVSLGK